MKKTVCLSLIAISVLNAAEPMVPESMSTDRGGLKPAIVAYTDGGGVMLYTDKVNGGGSTVDNSAMNNLVFKYGENAKVNNTTLQNQIKTIDASTSTSEEKALADVLPALNIASSNASSQNNVSSSTTFKSTPTNLVGKASANIRKIGSFWGQTGAGLLDGVVDGAFHTQNTAFYWAYSDPSVIDSIELTVSEPFRIWRSGYSPYPSYRGRLQILKVNGNGTFTDVSDYQLSTFQFAAGGPNTGEYELYTNEMPAGTYLFNSITGQYRIDIEWFIEKKI